MNPKLLCITIILSLLSSSLSYTKCNSSVGCNTGYKCCKTSSSYKCCRESTICSASGNYCISYNLLSAIQGEQTTPAISAVSPAISAVSASLSYVDIIMMVDGFLNGSKFYKNFPECTKAFTKLVSIAPQIGEFVVSLTKADGIVEILPIIIKAYDELYPKIKELIQESSGLPAEVKENFKKILATLKTLNDYINAFKHAFANIGDIVYNINAAKLAYKEQRYAQLGRYVGGAVSLLLNIQ